jgi:diguanylate cyclase (GGDEF)-like protein/PAS domain S-box-containing protein
MNKPIHDDATRSTRSRVADSDGRFRIIFDAVNDGIFISNPSTGQFIEVNEPGCRMFGYTRAELIGCDIIMLSVGVHPYTRERAIEQFQNASLEGPQVFEWHGKTKNGVLFWVEISLRLAEFGKIPVIVAIVRDVDERKRAADKIREAEAALVEAQAMAHVGSFSIDLLNNRATWSDECFRILGFNSATSVASFDAYLARIHPDDRAILTNAYRKSLEDRAPRVVDQRIVLADGAVRIVQQRWQNYYGADGKPLRTTGIVQDITERKNAENAITVSAVLHAVVASVAALIDNPSLDEGAPKALRMVGEALSVDRCIVVESVDRPGAPPSVIASYQWNKSGFEPLLPPFVAEMIKHPDILSWLAPLSEGKPVITTVEKANATVQRVLSALKSTSIVLIPIFVAGNNWGHIGLNDGTPGREWTAVEIETLLALATLFGVTIERGRQIQKLADADVIIRHSPTILYRLSAEPGLPMTYVSSNVDLFGYEQAELLAKPTLYLTLVHPDDRVRVAADLAQALRGQAPAVALEVRLLAADGTYRWVEVHRKRILGEDGKPKGVGGELTDITERKRVREQLSHTARHDFLTGLPNRAVFVEELQRAIASARRDGKSFAVLYLDLDHFKEVNDTLGHPVGDLLLQAAAGRLRAAIREVDVVARFGGDEFALINADIEDPSDAVVLADKVQKTLSEPYMIQGNKIRSGASVGIAIYGLDAPDAETLLSHADVALYRAKAEGRGTCRFFTDAMDTEVQLHVKLTGELHDAIGSGQLFLMYQPQVDIDTSQIIGVEALVRWHHPTRGIVSPGEFILAAEKSGLIVALGQWVLHEACRQMKAWLDAGIAPPLLAVNVSGLQFRKPLELEQNIAAILAETALSPELLELEITETSFIGASRGQDDVLLRLRKAGLRIAIDDFGNGYSSLDYLSRFPVDRIKIAQNFVFNLTAGSRSAPIVKASIGLAHDLGLDVIVEGVETAEQLELIRSFGGHKVQGFYFSKPLPAGEMAALLRAGKMSPASPCTTSIADEITE